MTTPQELAGKGLYRDAALVIDRLEDVAPTLRVLRADLEAVIGSPVVARDLALSLLNEPLSQKDKAACWEIVGRVTMALGQVADGLKAISRGLEAATLAHDPLAEARLLSSQAFSLLRCVGLEPATLELPKLRRAAIRAGDPFSLVEFHTLHAEVAAQRGLLSVTAKSIQTARGILERFPNAAQKGRVALLASALAYGQSDYQLTMDFAAEAVESARLSGARLLLIPALNNLVNVKMTQRQFEDVDQFLDELQSLDINYRSIEIAYLDTRMLLALAKDDLAGASLAARRIDHLQGNSDSRDSYYELDHLPTRVRWLNRIGEIDSAIETSMSAILRLRHRVDDSLLARLRLLAADSLSRRGRAHEAELMLIEGLRTTKDPSLELIAEGLRVCGRVSAAQRIERASRHFDQARRVLLGIGSLAALAEVDRDIEEALGPDSTLIYQSARGAPTESPHLASDGTAMLFDRVGVFLELGAHVPSLANETLSLIADSGAAYKAKIVAVDDRGRRETLASYASPDCPKSDRDTGVTIEFGQYRKARFEGHYVARPTAYDRATLVAIERLVQGAIAVAAAREVAREKAANWTEDRPEQQLGLICASERTRELVSTTRRVAQTNVAVLLTGETGVGKELFARALHQGSQRSDRTFLPFNCSTVPREMFDSLLFGHKRGSFTGAIGDSAGVIRSAAGGTLFLDEIGEMGIDTQPKLLRFLESGEVLPLGETRPHIVDVRVVAATNANLDQLVAEGRFREDLYYRLNVVRINIPPLRERREEIPALVEHFLERFCGELQKPLLRIADETLEYLILFRWPGNVRQLANEIRRLVAMAEPGSVIMPAHLSNDIAESRRTLPANRSPRLFDEVVTRIDQPLSAAVEHIERAAIQRALAMTDGHLDEAARILGLSRKGLYLKRQRLNLG